MSDELTLDELKEWLAEMLSDTLDDDATNSTQDDELVYDLMQEIYNMEAIANRIISMQGFANRLLSN